MDAQIPSAQLSLRAVCEHRALAAALPVHPMAGWTVEIKYWTHTTVPERCALFPWRVRCACVRCACVLVHGKERSYLPCTSSYIIVIRDKVYGVLSRAWIEGHERV